MKRRVPLLVGVVACLVSFAVIHIRRHRAEEHRKGEIIFSLHLIALGWHDYRSIQFGEGTWMVPVPEHGEATDSWRFGLLPYFEKPRPKAFDSSWRDGPYGHISHPIYCLTNDKNQQGFYTTNCLAVVGSGTIAESAISVFEPDAILVVAVGDTDVPWGEAGDLMVDRHGKVVGPWPPPIDNRWIGVCFADGRVWLLDKTVPREKLELFFTLKGARRHDPVQVLGAYKEGEWLGG